MMDEKTKQNREKLISMVCEFSDEYLDDEFKDLNIKLVDKLANHDKVMFNRGKLMYWACAIIFAVGQLNFLFEDSFKPYVYNDFLCAYFDANKQTIWNKARDIRRELNLKLSDEEFSTEFLLSLKIPSSDDDLKRIRTFGETKKHFQQKRPDSVYKSDNSKMEHLINEILLNNRDECMDDFMHLLRSSYMITTSFNNRLIIRVDENKYKLPLFTSMDKYKLAIDLNEYEPDFYAFFNITNHINREDFDGIVINPESDNFMLSKDMVRKIYPNPKNYDLFSIYFF